MNILKSFKYYLENLDCPNCAKKIENKLKECEHLEEVGVNFSLLMVNFMSDLDEPFSYVQKIIKSVEPGVDIRCEEEVVKKDYELWRLLGASLVLAISFLVPEGVVREVLILVVYGLLLYKTFIRAVQKIVKTHNIDENTLIVISAGGAYILGEHLEGIMVVALYVIGKVLEDRAVNKARRDIKDLLDLKINKASVRRGKEILNLSNEEIKLGDILIVKKGEVVAVDGEVVNGKTKLDTSRLTGESVPVMVEPKSKVLSGSINLGDVILVRATNTYYESTAYKIFMLTMNASNNKAKLETKVSKIAQVYTPLVLIIAAIIGTFLPVISSVTYSDSLYRALTFLVISCPCAIAISVPLSYFAGIGAASLAKVLVKGSNFLDALTKCKTIVFDKTGTLTKGSFSISKVNIYDKKYTEEEVIKIIQAGEVFSNHPLARVILNYGNFSKDTSKVKDFKEIEGQGISYTWDKKRIKVGSKAFVKGPGDARVYLAINDEVVASLEFLDNIKENAKEVIAILKKKGFKTMMLTGDNATLAKIVADKCGIDEYYAELLPDGKYEKLEEIKTSQKVIFVGDGINDTPVLTLADVGISMGDMGSNTAIEASDIVLMNDNLEGIVRVINIAFRLEKIIMMNLIFAFGVKMTILVLATLGYANMAWAVFADTGVTLITILNSLRILKK